MNWGDEHSVGHYLDFGSAVLGLTLFPVATGAGRDIGDTKSAPKTQKGPSPVEPGPSSQVVVELFLDLRLPRVCR